MIRERIIKNEPIKYLVPKEVEDYIYKNEFIKKKIHGKNKAK